MCGAPPRNPNVSRRRYPRSPVLWVVMPGRGRNSVVDMDDVRRLLSESTDEERQAVLDEQSIALRSGLVPARLSVQILASRQQVFQRHPRRKPNRQE